MTEAFIAGQVSEMIDALHFGDPTKTIVSSLLRLVRLLFIIIPTLSLHKYAASVPPSHYRVLIDRFVIIWPTFWLHQAKARPTRRIHSAWRVSHLCLDLLPESIALSDAFGLTDWELD